MPQAYDFRLTADPTSEEIAALLQRRASEGATDQAVIFRRAPSKGQN